MWMVKVRILPPQPIFAGHSRDILISCSRQPGVLPALPSAVHGFHIGVAHLLQMVSNHRGAKTTAAIQHELRTGLGNVLLDVTVNESASRVFSIGIMPFSA